MKLTHRPLTALERRNVDAVSALLAENDRLRERVANRNLVIVVLCLFGMVTSILLAVSA